MTALALGHGKVCAVAGGEVWCWRRGQRPARAARARGDTSVPSRIAIGEMYACVASASGELRCWWSLIDDFWQKPPNRDVRWPRKSPTRDVAVGDSPVCTVDGEGRVDCFLSEEGGLTEQAVAQSWATRKIAPHPIAGVDSAVAVGLGTGRDVFGYGFGCALRASPVPRGAQVLWWGVGGARRGGRGARGARAVWWGGGEAGERGTGDDRSSRAAVPVLGAR